MMTDRLYLGTWQFESLDDTEGASLIEAAHEKGIRRFDTAAVYGGGRAEMLLGKYAFTDDEIVTKIPAIDKQEKDPGAAYPIEHIHRHLSASTLRLGRLPNVALLHNWHTEWEADNDLLRTFNVIARQHGIASTGVSLPNSYTGDIESSGVYNLIDAIELPLNHESPLLTYERVAHMAITKKILARSLFMHGRDTSEMDNKIQRALGTGAHLVIGASKTAQIKDWGKL